MSPIVVVMDGPDGWDIATAIGTILAALAAAAAAIVSARSIRHSASLVKLETDRRTDEIRAQHGAEFTIRREANSRSVIGGSVFVLTNWGTGPATNVAVELRRLDGTVDSALAAADYRFPIEEFPGRHSIPLPDSSTVAHYSTTATITWTDETGDRKARMPI